jgi:transcriptional regulator with XRE-family HTH domain
VAQPVVVTHDPLAERLREVLRESNKTIYQLSADTGIDASYIWRIVRGERVEVSREVLMLISVALVLDKSHLDRVVETANKLLEAGGYKTLKGK